MPTANTAGLCSFVSKLVCDDNTALAIIGPVVVKIYLNSAPSHPGDVLSHIHVLAVYHEEDNGAVPRGLSGSGASGTFAGGVEELWSQYTRIVSSYLCSQYDCRPTHEVVRLAPLLLKSAPISLAIAPTHNFFAILCESEVVFLQNIRFTLAETKDLQARGDALVAPSLEHTPQGSTTSVTSSHGASPSPLSITRRRVKAVLASAQATLMKANLSRNRAGSAVPTAAKDLSDTVCSKESQQATDRLALYNRGTVESTALKLMSSHPANAVAPKTGPREAQTGDTQTSRDVLTKYSAVLTLPTARVDLVSSPRHVSASIEVKPNPSNPNEVAWYVAVTHGHGLVVYFVHSMFETELRPRVVVTTLAKELPGRPLILSQFATHIYPITQFTSPSSSLPSQPLRPHGSATHCLLLAILGLDANAHIFCIPTSCHGKMPDDVRIQRLQSFDITGRATRLTSLNFGETSALPPKSLARLRKRQQDEGLHLPLPDLIASATNGSVYLFAPSPANPPFLTYDLPVPEAAKPFLLSRRMPCSVEWQRVTAPVSHRDAVVASSNSQAARLLHNDIPSRLLPHWSGKSTLLYALHLAKTRQQSEGQCTDDGDPRDILDPASIGIPTNFSNVPVNLYQTALSYSVNPWLSLVSPVSVPIRGSSTPCTLDPSVLKTALARTAALTSRTSLVMNELGLKSVFEASAPLILPIPPAYAKVPFPEEGSDTLKLSRANEALPEQSTQSGKPSLTRRQSLPLTFDAINQAIGIKGQASFAHAFSIPFLPLPASLRLALPAPERPSGTGAYRAEIARNKEATNAASASSALTLRASSSSTSADESETKSSDSPPCDPFDMIVGTKPATPLEPLIKDTEIFGGNSSSAQLETNHTATISDIMNSATSAVLTWTLGSSLNLALSIFLRRGMKCSSIDPSTLMNLPLVMAVLRLCETPVSGPLYSVSFVAPDLEPDSRILATIPPAPRSPLGFFSNIHGVFVLETATHELPTSSQIMAANVYNTDSERTRFWNHDNVEEDDDVVATPESNPLASQKGELPNLISTPAAAPTIRNGGTVPDITGMVTSDGSVVPGATLGESNPPFDEILPISSVTYQCLCAQLRFIPWPKPVLRYMSSQI